MRIRTTWLPEATTLAVHDSTAPLVDRTTDVLELGRRFEPWHLAIVSGIRELHYSHLYEVEPGRVVFPGRAALVHGLARSRIFACFPASLTHPERSGGAETVTHRYFEAIASGCLPLGKCPEELRDLFGYDPVIPANFDDPVEQIRSVLSDIEDFQDLVDRNLARISEVGDWSSRVAILMHALKS